MITIAVVTPGLSYLRRLANSGKTWAEITVSGLTGEVSFTSLSYMCTEPCRIFASQPAGRLRMANVSNHCHARTCRGPDSWSSSSGAGWWTAHLTGATEPVFRGPVDRRWCHVELGDGAASA